MIRSKIAMGFLWAWLAVLLHVWPGVVAPAHAQGSRKDDIVFNSRGIPLAGATVRVCAMPASSQPCSPLALIYSDAALTQALANPTTTDGLGNYFFYAAPGKYEIEISGPSITTKQIPNVILPNDPSSPSFSAVSAFSLNLSGNLTVNGNTSVIGNLASGTLNLTNQSTPPGAASSGTVNLYTKTADKLLYYKDETGTETGPLGAGAQTNVTNNWPAQQNWNANARFKGPNPYVDVTAYGVRAVNPNSTPAATGITANCNSVTNPTQVTISSASTFQNGDGVVLYGCGAPHSLTTPSAPTVTPSLATALPGTNLVSNDVAGGTTYCYKIVARDAAGGLTAASPETCTNTGRSSLGAQSYTISSISCTNQTCTVTTSAPHGLSGASFPVVTSLSGTVAPGGGANSGDTFVGGWQMIDSAPTSTTFTFTTNPDTRNGGPTSYTGGAGTYWACNHVSWTQVTGAFEIYVYAGASGAETLLGVSRPQTTNSLDLGFDDFGSPMMDGAALPAYVPNAPLTAAISDNLVTTISSGAGTTTLNLANAAGTTVSGATIRFDNAPNILAAANATVSSGGTLTFPAAPGLSYVVNSYLTLPSLFSFVQMGTLYLNDTLQLGSGTVWRGGIFQQNGSPPSFAQQPNTPITVGTANPGIFAPNVNSSAYYNLQVSNASANNDNLLWVVQGGNQVTWQDVNFTSGATASDYMSIGLFLQGIDINNNAFQVHFKRVNFLGGNGVGAPLLFCRYCGQPDLDTINFSHRGAFHLGGVNNGLVATYNNVYAQGIVTPAVSASASSNVGGGMILNVFLDTAAVPCFAFMGASFTTPSLNLTLCNPSSSMAPVSGRPLPVGGLGANTATATWRSTYNAAYFPGVAYDGIFGNNGGTVYETVRQNAAVAVGNNYPLFIDQPAITLTNPCTVSSGGSLAVTTFNLRIQPFWQNSGNGNPSNTATCTTSSGNQTITLNFPAITGNPKFCQVYSGGVQQNVNGGGVNVSCPNGTTSLVITSLSSIGPGISSIPTGGPTMMLPGTQGISTPALTFAGSAISPPAGGFTATRSISFPDNSGIIPVTGYQNSAYDNATRANGAIGSNWTVTNNGINISSNNFVGTANNANDVAYWAVSTFTPAQFSQVTLTALNGTTDFPGTAVLLSGSGVATHGYNCVEDTTTIFIQKINGASNTTLTSAATTGVVGDILRLEVDNAGNLTCYKNGVSTLTVNDTTYTSGSPGLFLFGTVATSKNWSGGNLRPLSHLDSEQDWTKTQHFTQGIALGGTASESFNNSPRAEQNVFLPGALTSTWTGSTWTTDRPVTITRVQVQAKTAPAGCTTNAVVRLTDGTTPVNVTISAAANDSGAITQNYAAGASLTIVVQTAAAGCTTSPADANVTVQYRMQ